MNGTFLQQRKIAPHVAHQIRDGEQIMLGGGAAEHSWTVPEHVITGKPGLTVGANLKASEALSQKVFGFVLETKQ